MALVKDTDYIEFYKRLNSARSRFGLGSINIPAITKGTAATASIHNTFKEQVQQSFTDISSRKYTVDNPSSIQSVDKGQLISDAGKISVSTLLSSWESSQVNLANYSNYGNYGDYGDRSNKSNDTWDYNVHVSDSSGDDYDGGGNGNFLHDSVYGSGH